MEVTIILFILAIHWFADFVLQTDEQAKNKSTSVWYLTGHVSTYATVWMLASAYLFGANNIAAIFVFITFAAHWLTDFVTSKINKKLWDSKKVHWFFVSIGFDQLLHYAQLFLTYNYLIKYVS